MFSNETDGYPNTAVCNIASVYEAYIIALGNALANYFEGADNQYPPQCADMSSNACEYLETDPPRVDYVWTNYYIMGFDDQTSYDNTLTELQVM